MRATQLKLIISVGLLFLLAASTPKPAIQQGVYRISGEVNNIPDSTILHLYSSDIDGWKLVASDTIINGKFIFQDSITTGLRKFELIVEGGLLHNNVIVWVASGEEVNISGTGSQLLEWSVTSNLSEQIEENKYQALTISKRKELIDLCIPEEKILLDMFEQHAGDREYIKANWYKVDSIRNLQEPVRESIDSLEITYMKTAPINSVWMNKLLSLANSVRNMKTYKFTPQVMELFARIPASEKQQGLGKYIDEYISLKVVNIGDKMVDADLYDIDGYKHRLSEHKGKYILIDFWSIGCGPCRQSIPELEEIMETYKENLVVIGINIDKKEHWVDYVKEANLKGFQWNELREDKNGIDAKYQSRGIPHYVMISPAGKVIDIWTGYGPGSIKKQIKPLIK